MKSATSGPTALAGCLNEYQCLKLCPSRTAHTGLYAKSSQCCPVKVVINSWLMTWSRVQHEGLRHQPCKHLPQDTVKQAISTPFGLRQNSSIRLSETPLALINNTTKLQSLVCSDSMSFALQGHMSLFMPSWCKALSIEHRPRTECLVLATTALSKSLCNHELAVSLLQQKLHQQLTQRLLTSSRLLFKPLP